jgi:subtilisin family serine protease
MVLFITLCFILVSLLFNYQIAAGQNLIKGNQEIIKSKKLDSILKNLENKLKKGEDFQNFAKKFNLSREDQKVQVVIELIDENVSLPNNLGIIKERSYKNLVQAKIPIAKLEEISKLEYVKFISQPSRAHPDVTSQGTTVIHSDLVNSDGNIGNGINVAVIDQGFNIANPEISSRIVEALSFRADNDITGGGNTAHGTAVAEIIVDVAPGVNLYLYNVNTDVELLNLIDFIISNKPIDIINMSLAFPCSGPFDGTSTLAQKVIDARNNGILWVNSAGNSAEQHWSGLFSDSDADALHNFAGSDETIEISANSGQLIWLSLTWDETWGSASQDYDLRLYDASLNLIAQSVNEQNGNDNPRECLQFVAPTTSTYHIVIVNFLTTQTKTLELFSLQHDFTQYNVPSSSIQIPADSTGSLSVGATYYLNDQLESFSSRGPTNDGRIKPDLAAPDGVTTTGLGTFFGTSAAAPHAAGAAALVKFLNPGASPTTIQTLLEQNTFGNHAKTNDDGTGRVDMLSFWDGPMVPESLSISDTVVAQKTCTPPLFGDWIITSSCILASSATALGNVVVQNNSVLTISNGVTLNIDFTTKYLLIKSGSGVLIKAGGKIT